MIKIDLKGIDRVQQSLRGLSRELREKAYSAALNKVGAKARSEMTRAISDEFAVSQSDVRPQLRLSRADRNRLTVVLDPLASRKGRRGLNLIRFLEKRVSLAEARRRSKGGSLSQLRFKIKRGGAPKTIKGAFIGNKGRTVFARVGAERLPIAPLVTIDFPQMFNTRRINGRVVARIERELVVEVDRAVAFVTKRFAR